MLDGFRAIAILMVMGYHYFARWTPPLASLNKYPYGGGPSSFFVFQYGYLGVNLFFIISGFVISMTLFRSRSFPNFAWKRFSRLFPTMLLCSLITLTVLKLLPQAGFVRHVRDLLPGITFVDPFIWQDVTGLQFSPMDGAYWSLFVEVKFYFWVGLCFYGFGASRFLGKALIVGPALYAIYLGTLVLAKKYAVVLSFVFALQYLPWFIAGIGFYALFMDHRARVGWLLLGEAALFELMLYAVLPSVGLGELVSMALSGVLFLVMLFRPHRIAWLATPAMVSIGAASYSLYLLHQNIGVSLLVVFGDLLPVGWRPWSWWLAPCVAGVVIGSSLIIYRYWEMPAKRFLLKAVESHRRRATV